MHALTLRQSTLLLSRLTLLISLLFTAEYILFQLKDITLRMSAAVVHIGNVHINVLG